MSAAGTQGAPGRARIVVVQAMNSTPGDHWYAALRERLEPAAEVVMPAMPEPLHPDAQAWQDTLERAVGPVDSATLVIAHSVGNAAVLRYLSSLPAGWSLGGLVNVGGFSDPQPGNDATIPFVRGIDHELVRAATRLRIAFIGADDPEVPRRLSEDLARRLGSDARVVEGAGHFRDEDGYTSFPALEALALAFAGAPAGD